MQVTKNPPHHIDLNESRPGFFNAQNSKPQYRCYCYIFIFEPCYKKKCIHFSLKNGGLQRLTSLILKYFDKMKIYEIYLFTKVKKEKNEYLIPNNITRILITNPEIFNLINQTITNKIDILIYNFYNTTEINILNNLKNIKIIFYIHQSFLYWVYFNYNSFKSLYKAYQNSSYVISIVPFENDYLFEKWGIRSILMYN